MHFHLVEIRREHASQQPRIELEARDTVVLSPNTDAFLSPEVAERDSLGRPSANQSQDTAESGREAETRQASILAPRVLGSQVLDWRLS